MSPGVSAVIFDLDDTLFDCTGTLLRRARRRAARELVGGGLPMTLQEAVALQGRLAARHGPHFLVFDEIGRRYELEPETIEAAFRAYNAAEVPPISPFPDVRPALGELGRMGVKRILLTSGNYRRQQIKLRKLGLEEEFDEVLINDLERGGTMEECLRGLLDRYRLHPAETLLVGHRPGREIRAANQFGLATARMLRGRFKEARPRDEFEVADYRLSHIFQVPTIAQLREIGKHPEALRIVALGGGTGLPILLEGCKAYSRSLTAVVAVTDNGRSSGKLRQELGMLPPGDARNCLVALSEAGEKEKNLNALFQYRFNHGTFDGMSLGNLIIAAMTDMAGSFEEGIQTVSDLLSIQGKVLPATVTDCDVCARLADGSLVEGEVSVRGRDKPPIERVFLEPQEPRALDEAIEEIKAADIIVLGPGSLFTSVMPNLLVPAVQRAIAASGAPTYYVCNIMTQPGQTDGFQASDHLRALLRHMGDARIEAILLNSTRPSEELLKPYRDDGAEMVEADPALGELPGRVREADLIESLEGPRVLWEKQDLLRHDPDKVGDSILRLYGGLPARPTVGHEREESSPAAGLQGAVT